MKVILFSGGIDSTLLAYRSNPRDVLLCCNYGQPHAIEIGFARRSADKLNREFVLVQLPKLPPRDDVFPGRNAMLLSTAAGFAQARGYHIVQIGCNLDDAQHYPDCRRHFILSMNAAFGCGYGVSVEAPLIYTPRAVIVEKWRATGLEAWSCYRPDAEQPCGVCRACLSR